MLSIQVLGSLVVELNEHTLTLPKSRKTRALLGYLILSGMPQRRDRLCELFWDVPDDPRGALRWSLSKLRAVMNQPDHQRLIADRERVRLVLDDVRIDLHRARSIAQEDSAKLSDLEWAWTAVRSEILEDCDLPNHGAYSGWLKAMRDEVTQLRSYLAQRAAQRSGITQQQTALWAERWHNDAPLDANAAQFAFEALRKTGRDAEATALAVNIKRTFQTAGLQAPAFTSAPSQPSLEPKDSFTESKNSFTEPQFSAKNSAPRQVIRFIQSPDNVSLAWALAGQETNPPLIKAANWLSHLELDWEAPIWSPLFRSLAENHCFVRYDERGCGLSDWDVAEISFETFVSDLELIVEATGFERFPLLGISQGAAVCIEYAYRHPERVSHLLLFGGYPVGWRPIATCEQAREREAIIVLTEAGWGRADPAYRRLFSQTFMPDATEEELDWFDEFQRRTTSPKNAARFLQAFADIDVRERLAVIDIPTMVIHSLGDRRIPLSTGRELAAAIPRAEFIGLESRGHLLLGREPAATDFVNTVRQFLTT